MRLFRIQLPIIKKLQTALCLQPGAVTIGNFDGLHLGHQSMLKQLKAIALQHQLASTVVLFEPQPLEFFQPNAHPARLMSFRTKVEALREQGVDQVVCLKFTQALSELSPTEFIQTILLDFCQAKHIMIGDDFHFGHQRQGDFATLAAQAKKSGYQLTQSTPYTFLGERVSSSWVRNTLQQADFNLAAKLLNRPYSWTGKVIYGDNLATGIGFPTANLKTQRRTLPFTGVFAVEVILNEGKTNEQTLPGVANLGWRPTVNGTTERLEVHILDFNQNLYGERVKVLFRHKFRAEKKFNSLYALKEQILLDIASTRIFFNT